MIRKIIREQGKIVFDPSKPDGTPRKLMDSSHIHAVGWQAKVTLEDGLELASTDFHKVSHLRTY
jgi:GDP-L-fucose synthase